MKASTSYSRTGDVLIKLGLITPVQLDLCLRAQAELRLAGKSAKIGEIIVDYGFASQLDVDAAINVTGTVSGGLGGITFPMELQKRLKAYPLHVQNGILHVAAANSLDESEKREFMAAAAEAGLVIGDVQVVPHDRRHVLNATNSKTTPDSVTVSAELAELTQRLDDSSFITMMIEHLFVDALQSRASDIHLYVSKSPELCWLAHRIDGQLQYKYMINTEAMAVLATRIKSDAGVDFSDISRPHDGRTDFRFNGKHIDIRLSSMPVDYGESIILRLLDSSSIPSIGRLFDVHAPIAEELLGITASAQKSGGILLVTGATGSGKSTTLNAVLRAIDRSRRSIRTVEDPVELRVPLVGHTQVNEAAGLTYSKVLRSLLRQDPDVIMVGELRDSDTVETALRAAETGHMMLTTLHTGTVSESVTRLQGMMESSFRGIGRYILAGALKGVVNQRLVPRLCAKCLTQDTPSEAQLELLRSVIGEEHMPPRFYTAIGCSRCESTGFYGRVVVPEALFIGPHLKTREMLEDILINERPFRDAFALPGVTWYSRAQAVGAVLGTGHLDIVSALNLLEVRHQELKA